MAWDNHIFNVNGRELPMLVAALQLVFTQHGEHTTAKGWRFDPEQGLILVWSLQPKDTPFAADIGESAPKDLSAEAVAPQVYKWLKGTQAQGMKFEGLDEDCDHDGHNGPGWRVSTPTGDSYGICAIRPVFLWYGK